MPTVFASLDKTQYVKVATAGSGLMLQSHRDMVRVVFSDQKPAKNNRAFHELGGDTSAPLTIPYSQTDVWALATDDQCSLSVTAIKDRTDRTAFGEVPVAERTPIVQIYGQNGLRDDLLVTEAGSGAVSNSESQFICSTGTTPGSVAAALSAKQVTYRAGQGMVCLFTALFTPPVDDSLQIAGFINSEDYVGIGYLGTTFGVHFGAWGQLEYQELTITGAAAGAETATVGINGVNYTVDLTSGTQAQNAFEIATQLTGQVPNYRFSSNGSVVSALSTAPVPATVAFTFSSATATGTWVQVVAGALPDRQIIPLDQSWLLDQTKGTPYMLRVKYLGYGSAKAYIEHPDTSELIWSGTVKYPNRYTRPLWGNPTFRIGWAAQSLGSTTDLIVKGASIGAFLEGKLVRDERTRPNSGSATSLATGQQQHLFSLRNRLHFNDRANRVEVFAIQIRVNVTSTKTAFLHLDINPDISGGYLDFSYDDKVNSCVEIATDTVQVSSGREVDTIPILNADGTVTIDVSKIFSALYPSEVLTASVIVPSGASYDVDWSVVRQEDP